MATFAARCEKKTAKFLRIVAKKTRNRSLGDESLQEGKSETVVAFLAASRRDEKKKVKDVERKESKGKERKSSRRRMNEIFFYDLAIA